MSTLPYSLFKSLALETYSFWVCVGFSLICFPAFLYLYKLVKQSYIHNTLIINPPPPYTAKQSLLCVGGSNVDRGCSLKIQKINPEQAWNKHLKTSV